MITHQFANRVTCNRLILSAFSSLSHSGLGSCHRLSFSTFTKLSWHRTLSVITTNEPAISIDGHIQRHFSTVTGRRRRGIRSSIAKDTLNDTSPTQLVKNISNEHFQALAQRLLDKVESSMNKLKECNDGLDIERLGPYILNTEYLEEKNDRNDSHRGQLLIHVPPSGDTFWGGGTYKLTIHSETIDGIDRQYRGYISMQTPLSGTFNYVYNVAKQEWEGTEDGHSMLGMFTRDFIRQCQGIPDF